MAMEYRYETNRNRLLHVHDIYSSEVYSIPSHNLNGDLSVDYGASVYINRNVSGRPSYIDAPFGDMYLNYNSMGQRQVKSGSGTGMYYYIHDATGNVMAVYQRKYNKNLYDSLFIQERGIYGSSRLGLNTEEFKVTLPRNVKQRVMGKRQFELTDHLGNVNAVVSDRKQYNGTPLHISWNDYYPFGYPINSRSGNIAGYRYGFNGQEKDDEVYGDGKSMNFEFRMYDARLGRWWGVDPLQMKYPDLSPYSFVANNPILFIDMNGKEIWVGNIQYQPPQKRDAAYVEAMSKSDDFTRQTFEALDFLHSEGVENGVNRVQNLVETNTRLTIQEKTDYLGFSGYNPENKTLSYSADIAVEMDDGQKMPAVVTLAHELDHAEKSIVAYDKYEQAVAAGLPSSETDELFSKAAMREDVNYEESAMRYGNFINKKAGGTYSRSDYNILPLNFFHSKGPFSTEKNQNTPQDKQDKIDRSNQYLEEERSK